MRRREKRSIVLFLALWTSLVILLFLHTSGRMNIGLFRFPEAKGSIVMLEAGYKHFNVLGLREIVYAVPQGHEFIHPARVKDLKKIGVLIAHSLQEAKRMIDAGTEEITPKLILKETSFQGFDLYELGGHIYRSPAIDEATGVLKPYAEQWIGKNLDEAKQAITQLGTPRK